MGHTKSSLIYGERWDANALEGKSHQQRLSERTPKGDATVRTYGKWTIRIEQKWLNPPLGESNKLAEELVDDCDTFDVVKVIVDQFARRMADEEDKVITAGTGTGQPTGLTNCTITNVTCSGNLSFDNMIKLIYALPSQYRTHAKFLVHNNNIRELRLLKDSQNRPLWQAAVAPGQPDTFYGYPIIENNHLPESEIYFGDYKQGWN